MTREAHWLVELFVAKSKYLLAFKAFQLHIWCLHLPGVEMELEKADERYGTSFTRRLDNRLIVERLHFLGSKLSGRGGTVAFIIHCNKEGTTLLHL